MFRFLFGGLIGAALVYFLDPKSGAQRRNLTRDKATTFTGKGVDTVEGAAQSVAHKAQGVAHHAAPTQHDNPNPDDNTLKDRIESELFRDPNLGRDKLNINVVDGVAELRGELPTQADIQTVVAAVEAIRNVKGVESYLHTPDTPAPNKEEAIEAS